MSDQYDSQLKNEAEINMDHTCHKFGPDLEVMALSRAKTPQAVVTLIACEEMLNSRKRQNVHMRFFVTSWWIPNALQCANLVC